MGWRTFGTGLEAIGVFPAAVGAGTCVGRAVVSHEAEAGCLELVCVGVVSLRLHCSGCGCYGRFEQRL